MAPLLAAPTGWENFVLIASKPDNIPIVMMLILVTFFFCYGMSDARKNDKLIKHGRKSEILKRMQD